MQGLAYMLERVKHMPPAATTWDWDGEARSVSQGNAAMLISWGEDFPGFDSKGSNVVGLMEAARPPAEAKLRSPDQAGFLEIPHIGHQGGSSICLSNYSKNPEAAFIFMQWLCSKDVAACCHPRQRRRRGPPLDLQGSTGPCRRQGRSGHHAPFPGDRVDHRQRLGIRAQAAGVGRDREPHHSR